MFFPRPPHILFTSAMILGSLLALSSTNWLIMYAGMELNLFAFTPLIIQNNTNPEREAAVKYFLAQILGSMLLITGVLCLNASPALPPVPSKWFIHLGLMIKLGAAPVHFWFPNVMSGLQWHICLILTTWQKLFPLMFFFFMLSPSNTSSGGLIALLSLGAIFSAITGLNQTTTRGLLAYSSITHINWMLIISLFSPLPAVLYFSIYALSTAATMLTLSSSNLSSRKMAALIPISRAQKLILSTAFLSLAGLPPFLGFLPKWQALDTLSSSTPVAALPLLFASISALCFYLKISLFTSLTPTWGQQHPQPHTSPLVLALFIIICNLLSTLPNLIPL